MTYDNLQKFAQDGKIGKLPNFIGYFKWDYATNTLMFYNGDFKCKASDLDILGRDDFYYII